MANVTDMINLRDYQGKYFTMLDLKRELGVSGKKFKIMLEEQNLSWDDLKKHKKIKRCLSCSKDFKSKGEWCCKPCGDNNKKILAGNESHCEVLYG